MQKGQFYSFVYNSGDRAGLRRSVYVLDVTLNRTGTTYLTLDFDCNELRSYLPKYITDLKTLQGIVIPANLTNSVRISPDVCKCATLGDGTKVGVFNDPNRITRDFRKYEAIWKKNGKRLHLNVSLVGDVYISTKKTVDSVENWVVVDIHQLRDAINDFLKD